MAIRVELPAWTRPLPATGKLASVQRSWGERNFGPQRGPWVDEDWKGWWGDNPVFHTPVFVLTHHPRPTIEMEGGTSFCFIEATPAEALKIAHKLPASLTSASVEGPRLSASFSLLT